MEKRSKDYQWSTEEVFKPGIAILPAEVHGGKDFKSAAKGDIYFVSYN